MHPELGRDHCLRGGVGLVNAVNSHHKPTRAKSTENPAFRCVLTESHPKH